MAIILISPHLDFSVWNDWFRPQLTPHTEFFSNMKRHEWSLYLDILEVSASCPDRSHTRTRELTYHSWRALILPALSPKPLSTYLCPITFQSMFSFLPYALLWICYFLFGIFPDFSSGMRELRASPALPGCCHISSSTWSPAVVVPLRAAWFLPSSLSEVPHVASCLSGHTSVKCSSLGGNNPLHFSFLPTTSPCLRAELSFLVYTNIKSVHGCSLFVNQDFSKCLSHSKIKSEK